MWELAYNINGEPFDLPTNSAAWRVRKLKPKGAPEVVYGRDGLPLFLPMDADIEDLRREARVDGRYRLDPVDDHNRPVPNSQAGYVCVHPVERTPEPIIPAPPAPAQADTTAALVAALLESQKQHTELARMYVSQFPVIANAMAGVVRSAGDAGLTTRVPLVVPVAAEGKPANDSEGKDGADQDDEDQDGADQDDDGANVEDIAPQATPESEFSWARLGHKAWDEVKPLVGLVGPMLAGSKFLSSHARAANDSAAPAAPALRTPERTGTDQVASAADLLAHVNAIRAALPPKEAKLVELMTEEMPLDIKLAWINQLRGMTVPQAVAAIRAELAELQRNSPPDLGATPQRRPSAPSAAPAGAPLSSRPATAPVLPAARPPTAQRRDGRQPGSAPAGAAPGLRLVAEAPPRAPAMPPVPPPMPPTAPSPAQALLDETALHHITAIQRALTQDEHAAMRLRFAALSPADRSAWIATLLLLSAPEAVASVRAQIAADREAAAHTGVTAPNADRATATHTRVTAPSADVRNAATVITEIAPPELGTPTIAEATPPDLTAPTDAEAAPAGIATAAQASPEDPAPRAETPEVASTSPEPEPPVSTVVAAPPVSDPAPVLPTAPESDAAPRVTLPFSDENARIHAHTHMAAIESALTPDERSVMHSMIAQLPPEDRAVWRDQLLALSVADGAALLRDTIRELTTPELTPELAIEELDSSAVEDDDPAPDSDVREGEEEDVEVEELEVDIQALDDDDPTLNDGAHATAAAPAPSRAPQGHGAAPPPPSAPVAAGGASNPSIPTLDSDALTRFKAIENALTFAERMRAHAIAAQLPAAELRAWIAELTELPVPEGVAKIRAALAATDPAAGSATNGGVS